MKGDIAGAEAGPDCPPDSGEKTSGRERKVLPGKLQELWDGMEENRRVTLAMISGLSDSERPETIARVTLRFSSIPSQSS